MKGDERPRKIFDTASTTYWRKTAGARARTTLKTLRSGPPKGKIGGTDGPASLAGRLRQALGGFREGGTRSPARPKHGSAPPL
jgi:hypothetical protein